MPLQKSFSDQNHSANPKSKQQRLQWSRNRSYHGQQGTTLGPKRLQGRSPILVSTATRNKLHNFQFNGQSKNADNVKAVSNPICADEKENEDLVSRCTASLETLLDESKLQADQNTLELPTLPTPTTKEIPSTPGAKLALPDLIGMGDVRRVVHVVSPDEKIEWDHNKGLANEGFPNFGAIRGARKRAQSSSPPGPSSSLGANKFDPGSELWGRYSCGASNTTTPQGFSVPALAHLMSTSSPQSVKDGNILRTPATIRRAYSCGNHFPKRRRTEGADGEDVVTESAVIGPSKLSVLIERVQEGLTHSKSPHTPARNCFKPNKGFDASSEAAVDSTFTQEIPKTTTLMVKSFEDAELRPQAEIQAEVQLTRSPSPSSKSSDYGEFDLDELDASLLEPFKSSIETGIISTREETYLAAPSDPQARSEMLPWQEQSKYSKGHGSEPPRTSIRSESREFDESDDDNFTANLEVLASQFDARPGERAKLTSENPKLNSFTKEESDDEFGDSSLDDDDFEAAEATATQFMQQTANSLLHTQRAHAIQRYLVIEILDSAYEASSGHQLREKILLLQLEQSKPTKLVHLRGIWVETPVTTKAFVNVIGIFDCHGRCIVDDDNNLLILHPDHLISSTVVADSFGCTRRAILQDRIKATGETSAPTVYGTILHEIFQAAMLSNRWNTEWLAELIEDVAMKHIEELYTVKVQIAQAVEYLHSKMGELQSWAKLFVSSYPKPDAIIKAGNGEMISMCVSKLLDVEEHVWSPMYGLKGNIDATVQVTMKDGEKMRTLTVPLEVKTGRNPSIAHRAQTALYSLLISDRYDVEIAYGILYYMETSETIRIPAIRRELRYMIMQRNELACFVRERHSQLPQMLRNENMCNRCYAKVPCFIYHKLTEDGTGETSQMKEKFDEVVKHLTPKHREFFLKWDDLLTKEEKESLKFRRELWTMLSPEREMLGRCFSNVIIEPGSAYEEKNNPKINRYRYSMLKQEVSSEFSFLDSQITVGEPIVISDEKGHFALANGYVINVRKHRITVQVDRRLHNARLRQPGFDEIENQVFSSIMNVVEEGATSNCVKGKSFEEPVRYRLDKDEFSSGMATVRNNLIQVMANGRFGSRRIRGLVLDLNEPRFMTESTGYILKDHENINVDQRRAIQKVMNAEDYALVLGMPGTGKTTTIAHIIRALVSQRKSVLLTSYTHTAVDNILLKLKDDNIPILRLGILAKISPEVQEFATLAATRKYSFEEIRNAWHETPIVATTCLGINHAIFNERTFDYCIVDEASQITLPVCLGPILAARTFILVGDHYQLPPLVQNEEAKKGGLDISLFKHLSDTHPSSVVYLEHQYRMCEDVMALSNNLIYDGRLKCGNQKVAERTLFIPAMGNLKSHHYSPSTLSRSQKAICAGPTKGECWIRDLVDPDKKVSFINTDPLLPLSREEAKGNRTVNATEAKICTQLVEALLSVGVAASDIGVMTHYRSQLALLKHHLRAHRMVEMHTADRFQGRDKEVIIFSLVRSNEARSIGELLKDWRRINVAFTRAKTKLLVIGSRETLKGNGPNANHQEEMVARFVKLMGDKNWIYDLPKGALEDHLFEDEQFKVTASVVPAASRPCMSQLQTPRPGTELSELGWNLRKPEKKHKALGEVDSEENLRVGSVPADTIATGYRLPKKKIQGNRPYNIPRMGILRDVFNEAQGFLD